MCSSWIKCVLITLIYAMLVLGEFSRKNWVAQVWQAGLKGCFPLSPTCPRLSCVPYASPTKQQQQQPVSTHNRNQCKPETLLSSLWNIFFFPLRSRSKPHNSAPATKKKKKRRKKNTNNHLFKRLRCPPGNVILTTFSLFCNRAVSVACTYLWCI